MKIRGFLATFLAATLVPIAAWAVVVQLEVSPESVKRGDRPFSVKADLKDDGLVHFEVVYKVDHKQTKVNWIQANLVVRKGDALVAETHFPAFVREDSISYYFSISREYLADSTLELSDRGVGNVEGDGDRNPIPVPGGADYRFPLKEFAPKSPARNVESPAK
jgi:hypothetical protein